MKGKSAVLDGLNEVLSAELTAINQYFLHHALCEHWGYDLLARAIKQEAVDEMHHAESLIERLLYLDGRPDMQKYSKIRVGENVPDLMQKDLVLEIEAVERLNRLVSLCQKEEDHQSADLLNRILGDEEHHVDWLETQLQLVESLGLQNYLIRQISDTGPLSGKGGALEEGS